MKFQVPAVQIMLAAPVLQWSFSHRSRHQVSADTAASRPLSKLERPASIPQLPALSRSSESSETQEELSSDSSQPLTNPSLGKTGLMECKPFPEQVDADVGVLGCNEFSYCREDPRSRHGGFCEDEEVSDSFSQAEKQLQI